MMKPKKTNEFDEKELEDMVAAKIFLKEIGKTVHTEEATFTVCTLKNGNGLK